MVGADSTSITITNLALRYWLRIGVFALSAGVGLVCLAAAVSLIDLLDAATPESEGGDYDDYEAEEPAEEEAAPAEDEEPEEEAVDETADEEVVDVLPGEDAAADGEDDAPADDGAADDEAVPEEEGNDDEVSEDVE